MSLKFVFTLIDQIHAGTHRVIHAASQHGSERKYGAWLGEAVVGLDRIDAISSGQMHDT
jgi:hypothetical protein